MCINLGQNILVLITTINNLTTYNSKHKKNDFLPLLKEKRDKGGGHDGYSLSLVPIDQSTDAV